MTPNNQYRVGNLVAQRWAQLASSVYLPSPFMNKVNGLLSIKATPYDTATAKVQALLLFALVLQQPRGAESDTEAQGNPSGCTDWSRLWWRWASFCLALAGKDAHPAVSCLSWLLRRRKRYVASCHFSTVDSCQRSTSKDKEAQCPWGSNSRSSDFTQGLLWAASSLQNRIASCYIFNSLLPVEFSWKIKTNEIKVLF